MRFVCGAHGIISTAQFDSIVEEAIFICFRLQANLIGTTLQNLTPLLEVMQQMRENEFLAS